MIFMYLFIHKAASQAVKALFSLFRTDLDVNL